MSTVNKSRVNKQKAAAPAPWLMHAGYMATLFIALFLLVPWQLEMQCPPMNLKSKGVISQGYQSCPVTGPFLFTYPEAYRTKDEQTILSYNALVPSFASLSLALTLVVYPTYLFSRRFFTKRQVTKGKSKKS